MSGKFERSFRLPKDIVKTKENMKGKLEDGVLTVELPKQINENSKFSIDID